MNSRHRTLPLAALLALVCLGSAHAQDKYMFRAPGKAPLLAATGTGGPVVTPTPPATGGYNPTGVIADISANRYAYFNAVAPTVAETRGQITYAYTGLPTGITFNSSNGRLQGNLIYANPGVYSVRLTVTGILDTQISVSTTDFKFTVVNPVSNLGISQGPLSVVAGQQFKQRVVPALSGAWVPTYKVGGQIDTWAEYKYTYSNLPGNIAVPLGATRPLVEGIASVAGVYNATVEVEEKVYRKTDIGGNALVTTNTASTTFPVTVSAVQDATARFFRITMADARPDWYAHGAEIEFKDQSGNVLPMIDLKSNRIVGSTVGLRNGVKNVPEEVMFCETTDCDTKLTGTHSFVAEFANPVDPHTVQMFSYGTDNHYHYFYGAAYGIGTLSPTNFFTLEKSDDGIAWNEVNTQDVGFSIGAANGQGNRSSFARIFVK
ncbi:Ig domain-containing protein [Pararhizobium sp. BT-229]|uniref:Ig domain-containing protein n=1 Tax=Pararhizobium sp. BT-229 TaxID=2986923 RepID=UPI0021F6D6EE|nr:Ig domain-containing protein [Pararhizobium sp. BT-229]MCV9964054.1 Ig domain-containing protein [Pararhizobium sp. BT-229]